MSLEGPLLADGDRWVPGPDFRPVVNKRTRRTKKRQVIVLETVSPVPARTPKDACTDLRESLGSIEQAFVFDGERRVAMAAENDAQRTIIQGHERGSSEDGPQWDAQTEYDVGVLIACYLESHPPPSGASFAGDFRQWSDSLRDRGLARLGELGQRCLRAL